MENTLGRTSLPFTGMAQVRLSITGNLARLGRVLAGNQPSKTVTELSAHLRRDIGLSPDFPIQNISQPNLWRV